MIPINKLKKKAEERNYILLLENVDKSELYYIKEDTIICVISKYGYFHLRFNVDENVVLETIDLGSFMSDESFNKHESKFINYIDRIRED